MSEKLVRDNIPKIIERNESRKPAIRIASNDEEYLDFLFKKLDEEIAEFKQAPSPEEAADVAEVLEALARHLRIDPRIVYGLKKEKARERGSFKKRIILMLSDEPDMPKADP